jgi:glycosyltransferase involved in cell wall biosynthesis
MLRDAVTSVLEQSYRPIEIIIVDDGSTDDTPWSSQRRMMRSGRSASGTGPGAAREAGRQIVHGEFIKHLDSDDRLLPRRFERLVQALREHPEAGVAYGDGFERSRIDVIRYPDSTKKRSTPLQSPAPILNRITRIPRLGSARWRK